MNIFIVCSVRNATPEYNERLYSYVAKLEAEGHIVYLPPRDTNQEDSKTGGFRICRDNRYGIRIADEIHIFEYKDTSTGSLFDLGMAFMANKKIKIIGELKIDESLPKSFPKMMKTWEQTCETCMSGYSYSGHSLEQCPKCGEKLNAENI